MDGAQKILWLDADTNMVEHYRHRSPIDVASDTNNLLLDSLSKYQFEFQIVPSARIERLMMDNEHVCVTNRLRTPSREKKYLFSQPLNLYLGIRLYYLANHITMPKTVLNNKGQVKSLSVLFEHFSQGRIGLSKGRSYGRALDQQVKLLAKENVLLRSGQQSVISIIKMLARRRIDFTIEFPVELKAFADVAAKGGPMRSLEIAGSPSHYIGYVACKDNLWSRQFMRDVNANLTRLYRTDAFYQAHIRYFDEADKPQFDKVFAEIFR